MKIKKKQKRTIRYVIAVLLLLGFVGGSYYWYLNQTNSDDIGLDLDSDSQNINYNPPSQEEIDAGNRAKLRSVQNDQKSDKHGEDNKDTSSSDKYKVGVSVTASLVNNGKELHVGTIINGLYSNGTCKLTLSKGDEIVTRTAGVQTLAQYTTCAGFRIPIKNNLAPGVWDVHVRVVVSDQSAEGRTAIGI